MHPRSDWYLENQTRSKECLLTSFLAERINRRAAALMLYRVYLSVAVIVSRLSVRNVL